MSLSSEQVIELLGLTPHPTCGLFRETYRSLLEIPAVVLPPAYAGPRALGGVLYFLVTPQAPVRLHRIRSDQMYHHYLGEPLEVLLLSPEHGGEVKAVGPDLAIGMRPQLLVSGSTFHAARVRLGGCGYALLGTSVWLRAELADVEAGEPERLKAAFPAVAKVIGEFSS